MRVFASFLFLFISYLKFSAQDTIHFRNGDIKAVKVTEVGINEIKFYHFDNLTGPVRTSNKNLIWFIRYKDGFIDSIPKSFVTENNSISRKIAIKEFNLYYCERTINDRQFLVMINETNDEAKKNSLQYEFNVMRNYGKNHNNIGAVAGISAIGATFIPFMLYSLGDPDTATKFLIIMGTLTVSTTIFSINSKYKYRKQRVRTAQLYNAYN